MAKLLIVDDVKFISMMLKALFEERGHEVVTASNGIEALEKARERRPDLILTDIAMPQMDGLEVTRELKADPATKSIPVVVVSAKNDKGAIASAYAAGVADFIMKPFNNEQLLAKVTEIVGGVRMNFGMEMVQGIPVVTILPAEMDDARCDLLRQALDQARQGAGQPVAVDLSRVKRAPAKLGECLVAANGEATRVGGRVGVVASSKAVGLKAALALLEGKVVTYESTGAAVEALEKSKYESRAGIALANLAQKEATSVTMERPLSVRRPETTTPARSPGEPQQTPARVSPETTPPALSQVPSPAPAEPASTSQTLAQDLGPARAEPGSMSQPQVRETSARTRDAKRGLLIETRDSRTLVQFKRADFGGDGLEALVELIPAATREVFLDVREVSQFDPADPERLAAATRHLQSSGKQVSFVNPNPGLTELMRGAGLDALILTTSVAMARPANLGVAHPPSPTTASS